MMKESNIEPDISYFEYMVKIYSQHFKIKEAWNIIETMQQR
jgi:hypothetical protein